MATFTLHRRCYRMPCAVAHGGRGSRQRRACTQASPAIAPPARLHYLSLGWATALPFIASVRARSRRALAITHLNPSVASQAAAQTEGEGSVPTRPLRG